jgi:MFS-type transporter involved in bile tolerance (Atg22 family)
MHDYLINEGDLSISTSTTLIAIFGAGAAVGGVGGGLLGTYFYSLSKWYLPFFMGVTLILAALIMQAVLLLCIHPNKTIFLTSLAIGLAGSLASVNGSLSRAVLLNVSTPYTRGSSVSLLTILNSLGRGIGPSLMTFVMQWKGIDRRLSMDYLLYLWILSGLILMAIGGYIQQDEDKIRRSSAHHNYSHHNRATEIGSIGRGINSRW